MKLTEMDSSYLEGRIMMLMHHFKLNKNSLSQKLGLSGNSLIGKIVNEPGRGMTTDLLSKFAGAFPTLNLRWLVTGEGDMFSNSIFPDPKLHYIKYYKDGNKIAADFMRITGYEDCSAAYNMIGLRLRDGWIRRLSQCEWDMVHSRIKYQHSNMTESLKHFGFIKIVCTVSHNDHNPANCEDSNLRFRCQRCHNRYDRNHRNETMRQNKLKGQLIISF